MIQVRINGDARPLERSATVNELVEELDLPAPLILVEHNGTALRRAEWTSTPVSDGDRIEILRVAAGG